MVPKVVFWQIFPSHHVAAATRRLAERWPAEVIGVYDMQMRPARKALGWQIPDLGQTALHFLDQASDPARFVRDFVAEHNEAIHIFSGGCLAYRLGLKELAGYPEANLAFLAERPDMRGWKGVLKSVKYRYHFLRWRRRARLVLAIGNAAIESYRRLGCPADLLFPFMYQLDRLPELTAVEKRDPNRPVRFLYVGRCTSTKGVDILLRAAAALGSDQWELDLVGMDQEELERFSPIGLADLPVRALGKCSSEKVFDYLGAHDVAIVPSRYDGWGMAISEAIGAGIGVLGSSEVGAKDLIPASGAGQMVAAGDVAELARAMRAVIDRPETAEMWKQKARAYREKLTGEVVGDYLADVLRYTFVENQKGTRPAAPWLESESPAAT